MDGVTELPQEDHLLASIASFNKVSDTVREGKRENSEINANFIPV
jgi:hypothetical protein